MEPDELRRLENSLWEAADQLRANSKLNATEYSMPVLGLIFLRHATNRFYSVREAIEVDLPSRGGKTRPLTAMDFEQRAAIFLPEKARYEHLVELPGDQDLGKAIDHAMSLVEEQVPEQLKGVLPKRYGRFEKPLLTELVRIFNREELRRTTHDDLFGRIYEYFLNEFAKSGAQEGGEYFTPPSIVRTIVSFIEPDHGLILDPACGSGGMFVQAAHALHAAGKRAAAEATFHGQEKSETNTRLARMNLAVHGLEGKIRQGNTYYARWPELVGRCDFVMANPPFNVDMVDPKQLKGDPRLFTEKKIPGISKKTDAVSNANYLWIQFFHAYLNETGRAGFVMAQSSTDAGHGERAIREELIATGDVDIIVSIGTNFFYTRSLPCSLWFFDRGRSTARKDRVLMLDARSLFRMVSRKIRDFSDEHLANLTAIVHLYRGETERYLAQVATYFTQVDEGLAALPDRLAPFEEALAPLDERLASLRGREEDGPAQAAFTELAAERAEALESFATERSALLSELSEWAAGHGASVTHDAQRARHASFEPQATRLGSLRKQLNEIQKLTDRTVSHAARELEAGSDWNRRAVKQEKGALEEARKEALDAIRAVTYPFAQITWLQTRFPDARMADVPGLCKVVNRDEIAAQDASLTPGRYVGVAPPEPEDEEHVEERLRTIHAELEGLNQDAAELADKIAMNFAKLVG